MTRILIETIVFFSDTSVVVAMTISYTSDVANASKFGVFTSILIRWKGSVYKLVYKEMLAFMAVYFALNIFYRTILKNGNTYMHVAAKTGQSKIVQMILDDNDNQEDEVPNVAKNYQKKPRVHFRTNYYTAWTTCTC